MRTKRGADRLVKRLKSRGVVAVAMHGDRTQSQREKALGRFHAGAVGLLVATDVAARGIDVDDITHVINFDAPPDRGAYVHRVGRTGRAGRDGVGITFVIPTRPATWAASGMTCASTPKSRPRLRSGGTSGGLAAAIVARIPGARAFRRLLAARFR